jgi:hypothetical protein
VCALATESVSHTPIHLHSSYLGKLPTAVWLRICCPLQWLRHWRHIGLVIVRVIGHCFESYTDPVEDLTVRSKVVLAKLLLKDVLGARTSRPLVSIFQAGNKANLFGHHVETQSLICGRLAVGHVPRNDSSFNLLRCSESFSRHRVRKYALSSLFFFPSSICGYSVCH